MKNKYISKRYWNDISTPMSMVDELAKQYGDVINLSLGDPDLTTHDVIIENALADAKAGHTKYTDFRGDPELRREIKQLYKAEYDIDVDDKEIFVTAGGCLAMYLVLEAILDDGDEVIIQSPYFTPYPQQVELARGVPVYLNTYEDEDFEISIDRLQSLITKKTKAIIINTPNNPTGKCLTEDNLRDIGRIAKQYDLLIIADDIYGAFSYEKPFAPMLGIEGMKCRTITINSFSKDYTMTGWRIGNIIADENIICTIQRINENVVFTAPSVSQRAAVHAIKNRSAVQPGMVEEYKKRTLYAAKRANQVEWMSVLEPKGTFYLFINIKKTGHDSVYVSDVILRQAHVLTIPGISFGACGEGYVRVACTVGLDKLKEAFDRIEKIIWD